ncbi:MAG: glycosyltransferase family 2 protein, partial [Betaproteobacteria bacterium]
MPDLISVVIPTHNRSERLRQAIESVRTQGWKDLEIIVVDDASTDGTPALMEDLSKLEPRIRYIRNTVALGGGGARNAGIAAARGEYVAFLDDDDLAFFASDLMLLGRNGVFRILRNGLRLFDEICFLLRILGVIDH